MQFKEEWEGNVSMRRSFLRKDLKKGELAKAGILEASR